VDVLSRERFSPAEIQDVLVAVVVSVVDEPQSLCRAAYSAEYFYTSFAIWRIAPTTRVDPAGHHRLVALVAHVHVLLIASCTHADAFEPHRGIFRVAALAQKADVRHPDESENVLSFSSDARLSFSMTSPWHPSVPMCSCKHTDEHPVLVRWFALVGNGQPHLTLMGSCGGRFYDNDWKMECSVQTCHHSRNLIPSELYGIICPYHLLCKQKACKERENADNDVLFEARAKLSYWRGAEWTERGTGMLKLITRKDGVRLVMRNEKELLLNQLVRPHLTIGQSQMTICVWTEYDDLEEPPVMRTFHAKFDTRASADSFTAMMDVVRDHAASKVAPALTRNPALPGIKPRTANAVDEFVQAVTELSTQRRMNSELTSIISILAEDVIVLQPSLEPLFELYGWNISYRQFDGTTSMDGLKSLCAKLTAK